jgi:signal transduction histidine kinase
LAFLMGVATFVVMLGGEHNVHRGAYASLALATGWGFVGVGLWVWKQRSAGNIGPLMIAVGLSGLLKGLAFSNDSVVFAIASLGEVLIYAVLVHLLLSFPSGRLATRLDRLLVAFTYFNTTVVQLGVFLFTDSKAGCARCPGNPLLIEHSAAAGVLSATQLDVAILLLGAVVAILYRRWRSGTPGRARVFAPIVAVGGVTFLLLMTSLVVEQAGVSSDIAEGPTLALFTSIACLPFAFLAGLLRSRFSEADAISELLAQLGEGGGRGALRDALADALGDPTLELAYWVPSQDAYVDADGQPVRVDPAPGGKVSTIIEHEGERIAAIVKPGPDLAEERDLVQTAGAAAGLTLRNERLAAELRAKVAELQASRLRIVQAGSEQRRRLERDLHDGAQQRLMALGIDLRMVRERIEHDPQGAAELLDESLHELNEATAELRELARGIHPAVLTNRGLRAALKGLASRSPVPVELLQTPPDRLPASVESAVYFVVAEALTNAARYSHAQTVTVGVVRDSGHVDVEVKDDGVGGAHADQGSGLRGLADRVAALDGLLELRSPQGLGTILRATIPCA